MRKKKNCLNCKAWGIIEQAYCEYAHKWGCKLGYNIKWIPIDPEDSDLFSLLTSAPIEICPKPRTKSQFYSLEREKKNV